MKTLTLRLSDSDHASLAAASSARRMSMAALLMSLFDAHMAKTAAAAPAPKPLGKREQAFDEYEALINSLGPDITHADAVAARAQVETLRKYGGNLNHAVMPLPAFVLEALNSPMLSRAGMSDLMASPYRGMSLEELESKARTCSYIPEDLSYWLGAKRFEALPLDE